MNSSCYKVARADSFVHGELSQSEHNEYMLHLEKCNDCREEVKRLGQLGEALNNAYLYPLDETFNYRVVNTIRVQERTKERKEIRIAFEDIVISLATLLIIAVFTLRMFDRPTVSPVEMVGSLTNVEMSSVEQQALSNDQVLELVLRSK